MLERLSVFVAVAGLALAVPLSVIGCSDDRGTQAEIGEPRGEGSCAPICSTDSDCVDLIGTDGWACDGGFCVWIPTECDPNADGTAWDFTDCFGQPANCVPVDGVNTCVQVSGCADDQACADGLLGPAYTCTGVDDNATPYCVFTCDPGAPCDGFGTCNAAGNDCECTSDDECTLEFLACNNG